MFNAKSQAFMDNNEMYGLKSVVVNEVAGDQTRNSQFITINQSRQSLEDKEHIQNREGAKNEETLEKGLAERSLMNRDDKNVIKS